MKDLEIFKLLNEETANEARQKLDSLKESIWIRREELGRGRGVFSSADCSYDFLGESSMPKSLASFFRKNAPDFPLELSEVCVNRYKKGDYIGPHKDMDLSIKNVVVALDDSEDGLLNCETGEFIKDKKGTAVCLTGVGPMHSVPAVNDLRYVLIYLFE